MTKLFFLFSITLAWADPPTDVVEIETRLSSAELPHLEQMEAWERLLARYDDLTRRKRIALAHLLLQDASVETIEAYTAWAKKNKLWGRAWAYLEFVRSALPRQRKGLAQRLAGLARFRHMILPGFSLVRLAMNRARRTSFDGFSDFYTAVRRGQRYFFPHGLELAGAVHLEGLRQDAVNVVVMNHAHHHSDHAIMAEISGRLPGQSAILAAAHGWGSNRMARLAGQNPAVVQVGKRDDVSHNHTPSRLREFLEGGEVQNILIYPEGTTTSGLGEVHPLAPSFTRRILLPLLKSFPVNLIVVTSLDNYPILDEVRVPTRPARVSIGPIFLSQELTEQTPQELETLIRAAWLQSLPTDATRVLGQYRWRELLAVLRARDCEGALVQNF